MLTLKKDTTEADWKAVTGMTAAEFFRPVEEAIIDVRSRKPDMDEDDLTRDVFLKLAREGQNITGNLIAGGVSEYYSGDWFARVQARGLPDVDLLKNLMQSGALQIEGNDALSAAFGQMNSECSGSMRFMEHGHGAGRVSFGALALSPASYITMTDFPNIFQKLLKHCAAKYLKDCHIRILGIGVDVPYDENTQVFMPYDFVISNEVIEHCIDPVNEIRRIASCLRKGGLFYLSTFFNDCNGKNPSHLREHHCFQDTDKWFAEVEQAGFERYGYDQNGVLKVFRRI